MKQSVTENMFFVCVLVLFSTQFVLSRSESECELPIYKKLCVTYDEDSSVWKYQNSLHHMHTNMVWTNSSFHFGSPSKFDRQEYFKCLAQHVTSRYCINLTIDDSVLLDSSERIYSEVLNVSDGIKAVFPVYSSGLGTPTSLLNPSYHFVPLQEFSYPVLVNNKQVFSFVAWNTIWNCWPIILFCLICTWISGVVIWFLVSLFSICNRFSCYY